MRHLGDDSTTGIIAHNIFMTGRASLFKKFSSLSGQTSINFVISENLFGPAELGTPFNEEVEHLRRLVAIATVEGAKVSILTRIGRLSQDPDTVLVLCDNVKGLGTTLDPSHYICGPHAGRGYDQILKYVYHVELRDSTKDELQVRVGQGELEYSRLVNQLRRVGYKRALAVNMTPIEGTDHNSEMRKFRLLLESLL